MMNYTDDVFYLVRQILNAEFKNDCLPYCIETVRRRTGLRRMTRLDLQVSTGKYPLYTVLPCVFPGFTLSSAVTHVT
jgi:hypothetical protein